MAITREQIESVSGELSAARRSVAPIPANITDRFPELSLDEAYAIQRHGVDAARKGGAVVAGWKVGLAAKAAQRQFGFDAPVFGQLLNTMLVPEGDPISMDRLVRPIIEPEICFVLGEDLVGPGVTPARVLMATAGVVPAFEIPDLRYRERQIRVEDMVADGAAAALVVLGSQLTPVAGIDLRLVGLVLEKNGEVLATGAGAAVLGNPAQAVAALANKIAEFGLHLRAGEFIISGSLTAPAPVETGDLFRATFDRLGGLSVKFVA